jgi:hypothetical protein
MSANLIPANLSKYPGSDQIAEQDATEYGTISGAGPAAEAEPTDNTSPPVTTAADGPKAPERLTVPEVPSGFGADGKMPGSVCRDLHRLMAGRTYGAFLY